MFTRSFRRTHLNYIISIYILSLFFFSVYRVVIFLCNLEALANIEGRKAMLLLHAFWLGCRFDTVIICFLLVLPLVVGGVAYLLNMLKPALLKLIYCYIGLVFGIAFLVCTVDIPFFNHFYKRVNDTLFNWNNAGGFAVKMVVQEPRFYLCLLAYIVLLIAFLYCLRRVYERHVLLKPVRAMSWYTGAGSLLVIWLLAFIGIRGRLAEKSPIIAGTAFFSPYVFINQLGLNPVYTLSRSLLDRAKAENKELHWISDEEALSVMDRYFSRKQADWQEGPIARLQQTHPVFERRNVVLVIMESMAAHRMKRFGNDQGLTPFLDSLADKSWCFDSTFSAGIHTYNGIYATLFGHPALMKRHSLDMLSVPRMSGFPNVLADQGYQNIFFTTHDEQFDNMSGFLLANSFHTVVGQKDYPLGEVKSSMGVPDEFMFRFAIPRLNALAANGKPFFAALMTGSNHDPRIIPENTGFVQRLPFQELAVIEYADWSVQQLMTYAEKQSWYANTVFVFVADHGVPLWHDHYDIPFTFHHIPFFIFAPGAERTKSYRKLALQTDVFPTVMSLISQPYQNNTFGIDLFTETHRNLVFSSDDVLACMNDSLLLVYRDNRGSGLYRFRHGDKTDYKSQLPALADSMSRLAFAWLQTSQWMLHHTK